MDLKLDNALQSTQLVLASLSNDILMDKLVFAGGTALSLQMGNRVSEDIDLFTVADKLDRFLVDTLINNLTSDYAVTAIPHDSYTIMDFSDQGLDINDLHQNYSVETVKGSVKLSISVADINKEALTKVTPIKYGHINMADLKSIFALKVNALSVRHKKRDIYDLAMLIDNDVGTLEELFSIVRAQKPLMEQVMRMKITVWPKSDPDEINLRNSKMSRDEVRDDLMRRIGSHLDSYDKVHLRSKFSEKSEKLEPRLAKIRSLKQSNNKPK